MSLPKNLGGAALLLPLAFGACSSDTALGPGSPGGAAPVHVPAPADAVGGMGPNSAMGGTSPNSTLGGMGPSSAPAPTTTSEVSINEPPVGGSTASSPPATGGAGTSGETPAPKTCAAATNKAELTPANLVFVVDQSGSMNCNAPEASGNLACEAVKQNQNAPTKWELTSNALNEALNALSELPNVKAGVTTFPVPDPKNPGASCIEGSTPQVSIQPLDAAHRTAIDGFLSTVVPSGETPLAGTTILSYAYLAEQLRAETIDGNSFIVLLTDGTETCKADEIAKLIEQDVVAARGFNIRTFVIGAPGSEKARGVLSRLAFAGGTARSSQCDHTGDDAAGEVCHFDMTQSKDFSKDLADALRAISQDKDLTCRFDVPSNKDGIGVNLKKVNVIFKPSGGGEVEILNDPDADCENGAEGWQYTSDFSQIRLCGRICDQVSADGGGNVEIVLGCPIRRVIR